MPLLDARPTPARDSREQGRGPTLQWLGDDAMQPSPVALGASRIAEALPPAQRGRAIGLRRLDSGFLVAPHPLLPSASNTGISLPSATPTAAIAAGVLLACGIISAWNGPGPEPSAVAYIEVRIGADALRSAQTVAAGHDGAARAVETAFAAALDDLADQARTLRGAGAPATP